MMVMMIEMMMMTKMVVVVVTITIKVITNHHEDDDSDDDINSNNDGDSNNKTNNKNTSDCPQVERLTEEARGRDRHPLQPPPATQQLPQDPHGHPEGEAARSSGSPPQEEPLSPALARPHRLLPSHPLVPQSWGLLHESSVKGYLLVGRKLTSVCVVARLEITVPVGWALNANY